MLKYSKKVNEATLRNQLSLPVAANMPCPPNNRLALQLVLLRELTALITKIP